LAADFAEAMAEEDPMEGEDFQGAGFNDEVDY